jgi:hypothetical protein
MSALRFGVARRDGQLALSLIRHSGREARQGRDAIAEIESRIVAHREHELTVRAGRHADRANALDAGEVALEAGDAGDADETGHDDAGRSDLVRGGGLVGDQAGQARCKRVVGDRRDLLLIGARLRGERGRLGFGIGEVTVQTERRQARVRTLGRVAMGSRLLGLQTEQVAGVFPGRLGRP